MRFVVFGAGAIGGSIGARLAQAGADVALITRGAHAAAIRTAGLRVDAPDGAQSVQLPVVERPAEVDWREGDVVLLAVKCQDAAAALADLAAAAPAATPVACLTNGVEVERLALRWFDDVHGVCVWLPATLAAPGVVQQWSAPVRGVLEVGRCPAGATPLDEALAAAFRRAGCVADARADVMRWKRGKLVANAGNAVDALCGRGAPGAAELMERARNEARAVLDAAGLSATSADEEAARYRDVTSAPIDGARRPGGSTWQSLARGGTVETDYLNGEIARIARAAGLPAPVNVMLQRAAAAAARTSTRPGSVSVEALLALAR